MNFTDTIAAPATAQVSSAIAILRVSGADAFVITERIFDKKIEGKQSHTLHFGNIKDGDEFVDEVLVSVFKNPHSYTGEDIVEISCHGSPYIQQRILGLLLKNGARMAEPGEFTMRAFKNGKLDLTQAEAVADLIASDSKASHQVAMNQLRGGISTDLSTLRKRLIHFAAMMELELDFSGEDVEFANRAEFVSLLQELQAHIRPLIASFAYGNALKQGVPVAIIGKPNAGKSSLLNALLNEDKAIVSEIAGTTRDVVEDTLVLDGIKIRFIDTAGIRETEDEIESIGVERAMQNAQKSKVVVALFDRNDIDTSALEQMLSPLFDLDIYLILTENKMDLLKHSADVFVSDEQISLWGNHFSGIEQIQISAHNSDSVQQLSRVLITEVKNWKSNSGTIITQTRHLYALQNTNVAIENVLNGLEMGIPTDLLAQDVREAIRELGSITGAIEVDRDVLGTIFGEFCIGK